MEIQASEVYSLLRQLHDKEVPESEMQAKLKERGLPDHRIAELIAAFKKQRADERQRTGFILSAVGSLFCFVSCILTLINPLPELREFILFGITSLGVVVIFVGFYYIFEP